MSQFNFTSASFTVITSEKNWFVYIILTVDEKLYTGITTDLTRRLIEHRSSSKGAKFFRFSNPKSVEFVRKVRNRSEASKLEAEIKKLSRIDKLKYINEHFALTQNFIALKKLK